MASVPYEFECDKNGGFLPDPNEHKRVGYLTALKGFGQTSPIVFKADLQVFTPWNSQQQNFTPAKVSGQSQNSLGKLTVVGVMEKFAWDGGVGGAITFDFWCSQENAIQLKAAQQSTLTTTRVDQIQWWIINFDQEKKIWYEQSYPAVANPASSVSGIVGPSDNPELNVDLAGAPAKDGIDVMVYKVSVQVAPGANQQFSLCFANSATTPNVKSWGLVVGTLAAAQYG